VSVTQDDGADVISGTRYPRGFDAADADSAPSDRREINRLVTETLNRRLGLRLSDAFCGFKAYRVSALRSLRITVPGYAMPIQFWVQAARLGLRIRELPVRLIYKDPTRHFGGMLDDPSIRLRHYLALLESELRHAGTSDAPRRASCAPCR
jgi:dolichol-phosphate mannosyltransferase